MFNWSWRFRTQSEYVSPVGPNFNCASAQFISLNGVGISLKLPRHKTQLPVESITFRGAWNVSQLENKLQEINGVRSRFCSVFVRKWDFNGSWFLGKRGSVTMTATVMSPAEISEGLNYFHPRALEAAIAEYLTSHYGSQFDDSSQYWHAPVDWKPLDHFPCIAARFNAVNTVVESSGPLCFLAIPVAKTHYIIFECEINRATVLTEKRPEPTIDEWIDLNPFLTLANQVLDSIKVELSPEAKAEQEAALQGLSEEEKQLVREYPPLKWMPPSLGETKKGRMKLGN